MDWTSTTTTTTTTTTDPTTDSTTFINNHYRYLKGKSSSSNPDNLVAVIACSQWLGVWGGDVAWLGLLPPQRALPLPLRCAKAANSGVPMQSRWLERSQLKTQANATFSEFTRSWLVDAHWLPLRDGRIGTYRRDSRTVTPADPGRWVVWELPSWVARIEATVRTGGRA